MIEMLYKALQMFSIHYCANFLLNRTRSFAVWLLMRKLSILEMFTYLFYSMNILISFCIMYCSLHNMFDKSVYNNTTYVINCDYSKVPISETLSWNGKVHRLSGVSFKQMTGYRENISGEMKKSFDLTKVSINSVSLTGTVQQSQNNTNKKIVNLQNDLNRSIKFSHSLNKNFLENNYSIIHIILLLYSLSNITIKLVKIFWKKRSFYKKLRYNFFLRLSLFQIKIHKSFKIFINLRKQFIVYHKIKLITLNMNMHTK